MSDEAELSAKARHEFRVRLGWALAAGPGNFVAIFLLNTASLLLRGHGFSNTEFAPVGVWYLASFAVTSVRFRVRRCPRCGKVWNHFNPFASRCSSCQLPR